MTRSGSEQPRDSSISVDSSVLLIWLGRSLFDCERVVSVFVRSVSVEVPSVRLRRWMFISGGKELELSPFAVELEEEEGPASIGYEAVWGAWMVGLGTLLPW